jgi:hypothetical protein
LSALKSLRREAGAAKRRRADRRLHGRSVFPDHIDGGYLVGICAFLLRQAAGNEKTFQDSLAFRAQTVSYDWAPAGTPRGEKPVAEIAVTQFRVPQYRPDGQALASAINFDGEHINL